MKNCFKHIFAELFAACALILIVWKGGEIWREQTGAVL